MLLGSKGDKALGKEGGGENSSVLMSLFPHFIIQTVEAISHG